ncbi:MAG: hypothetical protein KKB13_26020 [Chloroflexi bacterium]|nr:hypothetical protein [Chloroflexota bacterium]
MHLKPEPGTLRPGWVTSVPLIKTEEDNMQQALFADPPELLPVVTCQNQTQGAALIGTGAGQHHALQLALSKAEHAYVVGRLQGEKHIDVLALQEIGLTEAEIAVCLLIWQAQHTRSYGVASHVPPESLLYAIHALDYLPRTNAAGQIDTVSYYSSVYGSRSSQHNQIDYWLEVSERTRERALASEGRHAQLRGDHALVVVLRQVVAWCQEFEARHPRPETWPTATTSRTSAQKRQPRQGATGSVPPPGTQQLDLFAGQGGAP